MENNNASETKNNGASTVKTMLFVVGVMVAIMVVFKLITSLF